MRFVVALWALFFAVSVYAGPTDTVEDAARSGADLGLLSRISEVGSKFGEVGSKIGEVGSRIGEVGSKTGEVGNRVEVTANSLVGSALSFLGVPYRRGGTTAESGFDCSGFVRSIYQQTAGLLLPHNAAQQAASTQRIDKNDLKPGDLVFFNTMRRAFSHVGIYVGNGKFTHAPKPGAEVRVEDLGVAYWAKRFDGARRVPEPVPLPDTTAAVAAPAAQ